MMRRFFSKKSWRGKRMTRSKLSVSILVMNDMLIDCDRNRDRDSQSHYSQKFSSAKHVLILLLPSVSVDKDLFFMYERLVLLTVRRIFASWPESTEPLKKIQWTFAIGKRPVGRNSGKPKVYQLKIYMIYGINLIFICLLSIYNKNKQIRIKKILIKC